MSDTLELAKQCGAKILQNHCEENEVVFYTNELQAFRDACVKEATEELQARIAMQDEALQNLMELEKRDRIMPIGIEWDAARKAISATSEDVAAWREKRDKEVAAKALASVRHYAWQHGDVATCKMLDEQYWLNPMERFKKLKGETK